MKPDWMKKENTGMWTVLDEYITTPKGERKYLCRCDCGTERYVLERSLKSGGSKSCGCITRKRAIEKVEHKLDGKMFGELTVLRKAEKKQRNGGTWWVCRCSCGNVVEVPGTLLVTGRKNHCGCNNDPQYYHIDITEQVFGRLTAKYPLPDRDPKGNVIWHCVCECGNEIDVSYNCLAYSSIRSCGCQKKEHDQKLQTLLTRVDGTSLDMIKSKKIPADNTSGVRGVGFSKGKWFAKIVFQKKQYHLGRYDNIEDAISARKEAEKVLFDGATEHYYKWKTKAEYDPYWAEKNPIQILVSKKNTTELCVMFLPEIM